MWASNSCILVFWADHSKKITFTILPTTPPRRGGVSCGFLLGGVRGG